MPIIKQTKLGLISPIIIEINEIPVYRKNAKGKTRYKTSIIGGKLDGITQYSATKDTAMKDHGSLVALVRKNLGIND